MRGLDFSVRKWYFFFLFLLNYSDFFSTLGEVEEENCTEENYNYYYPKPKL